jgi:hypothetical protein
MGAQDMFPVGRARDICYFAHWWDLILCSPQTWFRYNADREFETPIECPY